MSGHNKWSKIKRTKGALDAKRGMLFSRFSKEIALAAKAGGSDPGTNHRLRAAIDLAKEQSMPSDNIERAIKRGSGELAGAAVIEETVYEGYAPGGVALLIEVATDNRNRTAADLRSIFTKKGGSFASSGSVAYLFHRKGHIVLNSSDEEKIFETALDAGAEDIERDEDDASFLVITPPDKLYAVATALINAGLAPESQKLEYVPENHISVTDERTAHQILELVETLENCDDVMAVHPNADIPDEFLS